jgi:hypothetical protein
LRDPDALFSSLPSTDSSLPQLVSEEEVLRGPVKVAETGRFRLLEEEAEEELEVGIEGRLEEEALR